MPKQPGVKLPRTLQRSPEKAQRLFLEVKQNAEAQYGPGEKASRTAYAALKQSFERIGDHWEAKEKPAASGSPSRQTNEDDGKGGGVAYGGIDAEGRSRKELLARAQALRIPGRWGMSKSELAQAINMRQH